MALLVHSSSTHHKPWQSSFPNLKNVIVMLDLTQVAIEKKEKATTARAASCGPV